MRRSSRIVQFGAFEANLETGELRKHGLRIGLPDQAFQVLLMLLEHPGELITREELRERLWQRETFVDFDAGLNKVVNRLRHALNDSAANPRFVETVARRGYRLLVSVTAKEGADAPPATSHRLRLAVLPFENLGPDPEQEFFSDGLTEELISELGRLNPKRLGVIARTSAMAYKHSRKRVGDIGRELNVDYILEGGVRRADTRARITAQLIRAIDETHLWAESYDRDLADILRVQHEIARHVADSLAFELLPDESTYHAIVSTDAHAAYLRGRFFWNKGTGKDATTAISWFEKTLEHDPKYALAYSGIADCYLRLGWFNDMAHNDAGAKAKTAATQALKLEERLGEIHASMALVHFWHEWNWMEAEREFETAIDLKPNYAAAHNWYAAFLNVMQRFDEAAKQQKRAEDLDPLSLIIAMNAADPYYFKRQYFSAIEHLERVLKREANFFPAYYNLGRAYVQSGMYQETISAFETALRLSGVRRFNGALGYTFARAGDTPKALAVLEEMEKAAAKSYVPSPEFAWISLGLGNFDQALERLEQGFEERSFWMVYLQADPIYDYLRSHPGFVPLLQRMNFASRAAEV